MWQSRLQTPRLFCKEFRRTKQNKTKKNHNVIFGWWFPFHFPFTGLLLLMWLFPSMPLRMGGCSHLLNGEMTITLVIANIPLLCGRLKGPETCKCSVLLSPLVEWEAPHWWVNGVWTMPRWKVPDVPSSSSYPLPWTLKACFLPHIWKI